MLIPARTVPSTKESKAMNPKNDRVRLIPARIVPSTKEAKAMSPKNDRVINIAKLRKLARRVFVSSPSKTGGASHFLIDAIIANFPYRYESKNAQINDGRVAQVLNARELAFKRQMLCKGLPILAGNGIRSCKGRPALFINWIFPMSRASIFCVIWLLAKSNSCFATASTSAFVLRVSRAVTIRPDAKNSSAARRVRIGRLLISCGISLSILIFIFGGLLCVLWNVVLTKPG